MSHFKFDPGETTSTELTTLCSPLPTDKWGQYKKGQLSWRKMTMAKKKSKMIKGPPPTEGRARIALYIRVSTDKQREEGYSLEIQEEQLRTYVKSIDKSAKVMLYKDDGFSGGSLERPSIQQLIRDAKAKQITHVVVLKLDRISRSQKDTLYLIEDIFLPNDITFISVQESFNTNSPFGRATIGMLSVFAQLERENIYDRTRAGMLKRVEQGYWPGGANPPLGYDYDPSKGILIPNADADKVRYLFEQYISGASLLQIADDIGIMSASHAHKILTRKTYTGLIVYNGAEYQGLHEPIISSETFDLANRYLKQKAKRHLATRTNHLLSGLFVCGVCGAGMRYQKWNKNEWRVICYSKCKCKSKPYLVKDPNCDNEYLDTSVVEQGVLDCLFSATDKDGTLIPLEIPSTVSLLDILTQRYNQVLLKLKRLYDLYSSQPSDMLKGIIAEDEKARCTLEGRISQEKEKRKTNHKRTKSEQNLSLRHQWEHLDFPQKRMIVTKVIKSITITHGRVKVRFKADINRKV